MGLVGRILVRSGGAFQEIDCGLSLPFELLVERDDGEKGWSFWMLRVRIVGRI